MIVTNDIYESYTPKNAHLMREYMLLVIRQNIKRMLEWKTISKDIYEKFKLFDDMEKPENQSEELTKWMKEDEKSKRLQDPEYLIFDSMIESGNLERVEAFLINHRIVD